MSDRIDTLAAAVRSAIGWPGHDVRDDALAALRELETLARSASPQDIISDSQRTEVLRKLGAAEADAKAVREKMYHNAANLDVAIEQRMAAEARVSELEAAIEPHLATMGRHEDWLERSIALGAVGTWERELLGAIRGIRAALAADRTENSGGDPGEVRPSSDHGDEQAELNGPSGSPTSPPGRVRDPEWAERIIAADRTEEPPT